MPLYEYQCTKNGHRFELIRKFSDPPLTKCTKCNSKVERLPSAPAIAFKGSGWYITDYARKNGTSPSVKSAKPDSDGSGTAAGSDKTGKAGKKEGASAPESTSKD